MGHAFFEANDRNTRESRQADVGKRAGLSSAPGSVIAVPGIVIVFGVLLFK